MSEPRAVDRSIRRHLIAGGLLAGLLVIGAGGWAATTQLSGAVIAPGTIVVESYEKRVQHPTGGIVAALKVRDGDAVHAGDLLVRLDATIPEANLAVVTRTLNELAADRARLEAERDGADALSFPPELTAAAGSDAEAGRLVAAAAALFAARRTALDGQKAQLREGVTQLRQEIEGLEAQHAATERQAALVNADLANVEDLFKRDLVPVQRLTDLRREAARLAGEAGRLTAAVAEARGRIAETELKIIQLDQDRQTEVLKELRETEAKIGEYTERRVGAEDELRRIDIRSPQDGIVHELAVHTVGGVVAPGDTLMLIVPATDILAIDARIAPQDVDQIFVGQRAVLRLTAFNQAVTPEFNGTVTRVSADLVEDPNGASAYYLVRIALDASADLGRLKLVPGMPAEVHVQTGERTALSYFVKPLTDQIARAFQEQ